MSDIIDGPSSAARRALDSESRQTKGFFQRLFGSDEKPQDSGANHHNGQSYATEPHSETPLGSLVNLRDVDVNEVAVPKADIVAVPLGIHLDALVDVFRESGLSRLPVYKDTLDNPIGMVHLKDLALEYGFGSAEKRLNLRKRVRPLLFAPPSMPIGVLLQKMQSERIHMALVIDEYGGVDGLVTIEDLIEQVVGEISDEHDVDDDQLWSLQEPGVYVCSPRAPLDEFEAEIGLKLIDSAEDEEIETIGGLVYVLAGRVPVRGEVIQHPKGVEFEILDADLRRVKRLRVIMPHATAD